MASVALYPSPVTDPWFNAQTPVIDISKAGNTTLYAASQPVSVLGCIDQTEICNARNGSDNCVPLPGGLYADVIDTLSSQLQLSSKQAGLLRRFHDPIHNSIDASLGLGGDGNLLASAFANKWLSTELPSDQWILELQHAYITFIISVQLGVVKYVNGLSNPAYNHWVTPASAEEAWMCKAQIVQRDDYASFSILGLAIILCFGLLMILINLTLSTVSPRLCRRSAANKHRNKQWATYELLKLQLRDEIAGNEDERLDLHSLAALTTRLP